MLSTPLNTTSVHGSTTSKSNFNPLPTILPVLPALTSCSHFHTHFFALCLGQCNVRRRSFRCKLNPLSGTVSLQAILRQLLFLHLTGNKRVSKHFLSSF